jgi:hypothetical protein
MMQRASNRWRRFAIEQFARRDFTLPGDVAYVSFTFDDFPRSALTEGGRILVEHGVRGTYFVSFQLLNAESPSGRVASLQDLQRAIKEGHELGCHTFGHLDGSVVTAAEFERSIEANRAALLASRLGIQFETFAYPLNGPALQTKRVAGARFSGCRGGGQVFNSKVMDLSHLKAYFLDRRNQPHLDDVTDLINRNAAAKGWLIFATHDVGDHPSQYGCDARDFEAVVRQAIRSGARVLPMAHVCRELGITHQSSRTTGPESPVDAAPSLIVSQ